MQRENDPSTGRIIIQADEKLIDTIYQGRKLNRKLMGMGYLYKSGL